MNPATLPDRYVRWFGAVAFALIALVYFVNVAHYAFQVDDAFISFRYAQNFTEGHGLVWNPGERVEGYTNFLWVVLIAAGMMVGAPPEISANVLGIASGIAVLSILVLFSARSWGWRSPACWLAPAALALSRSFTAWSTGGLATQFFSLLVTSALLTLLVERRRNSRGLLSSLLFGLAALTRPEGILFAAVAAGFQAFDLGFRRRDPKAVGVWLAPVVSIVAAHFLWRYGYYGAWLPNTFYAKVTGFSPEQSLPYFRLFLGDYALHWFLPLALAGSIVERRLTAERVLLTTAAIAYLAYVFYVGGDLFEFRFLVPVLPIVYWLIADGIRALARTSLVGPRWVPAGLAIAIAGAWGVATHRGSVDPAAEVRRGAVTSIPWMRLYTKSRASEGKLLHRLVLSGQLAPDTTIAVSGAGALPYYSRLPTVDTLGLNDAFIARQPVKRPGVVGHERAATAGYLKSRHVAIHDALNRLVFPGPPEKLRRRIAGRPLHAIRVGENKYLVFETTLDDAEFDRVFARFERVF